MFYSSVIAQLALASFSVAAIAFVPQPHQAILLVPLNNRAVAALPRFAFTERPRLLRAGPVRGSFVVVFAGDAPFKALLAAGILPIAARASSCGTAFEQRHG